MIFDPDTVHWITRLVMASSFLLAMGALFIRGRRALSIFYLLAAIETYTKLRYPLQNWSRNFLFEVIPYHAGKQVLQIAISFALFIAISIAIGIVIKRIRNQEPANILVLAGTVGIITILALELVSIRFFDRFIYATDGPLVRSGTLYSIAALVTTFGALFTKPEKGIDHKESVIK